MAVREIVGGFLDFMGRMGLALRGDPPRRIDVTGRHWGQPVNGIALSIREILREDPAQLASVSAVMKNNSKKTVALVVPGWLNFYSIEIAAPLTPYGGALRRPEARTERLEIALGAGDATETDLPLGALYEMHEGKEYRVRISCKLPDDSVLQSNEIVISA